MTSQNPHKLSLCKFWPVWDALPQVGSSKRMINRHARYLRSYMYCTVNHRKYMYLSSLSNVHISQQICVSSNTPSSDCCFTCRLIAWSSRRYRCNSNTIGQHLKSRSHKNARSSCLKLRSGTSLTSTRCHQHLHELLLLRESKLPALSWAHLQQFVEVVSHGKHHSSADVLWSQEQHKKKRQSNVNVENFDRGTAKYFTKQLEDDRQCYRYNYSPTDATKRYTPTPLGSTKMCEVVSFAKSAACICRCWLKFTIWPPPTKKTLQTDFVRPVPTLWYGRRLPAWSMLQNWPKSSSCCSTTFPPDLPWRHPLMVMHVM